MTSLDFFNLPNPSSRTMALGLTQTRTEVTQIFLELKARPALKTDNFTANFEPII
jgi:hypothetical protein